MPNWLDILGQTMTGQAAGGILGMAFGGINDQRQLRQQEDLQRLQIQGQKEMTDYGFKKQLQMWLDTNYSAQVEQLKKAGLNPALLYGMGGSGGATTGGGTGTVQGGHSPTGGGEMQTMAGMGIGAPLIAAQIEKTKAETANINADTANKPIQGKNIQADTENKLTQNEILEIENHIKGRTQNMAIAIIQTELSQKTEQLQITANEKKVSDETLQQQIDTVKAELSAIYIRNLLIQAQTINTRQDTAYKIQQIVASKQQIIMWVQENMREWDKMPLENRKIRVQEMIGQTIEDQAIWNTILGGIDKLKNITTESQPKRNPIGYGR